MSGATSQGGAIASAILVCRRYGTTAQVDGLALPAGVIPEAV